MPPRNETAAPAGAENSTLYVAIEISRKSWVVGIKSPVNERIGLHTIEAANVDALRDLIERHRAKAERVLKREMRVLNCYEAGYEGFWLARWLDGAMALETVVLDPASLLVNRKAKQRKTDRIDAKKMVRALLAHDRGAAAVLSRVRVPSVEQEDRQRLHRERQRLVKERTSLTNSIKGLLWTVDLDGGCARGRPSSGGGEDRGADPAEGDRSERRNHPDARGLLPRVPQSSRTRELGRCDVSPLGERRHATRPGDQPRRSSMDPGTAHPNGVALAALSA